MIVIGLGASLPVTKSLAFLLDSQKSAACFHELNPSCMRYKGTPQPVKNSISEFKSIIAGGEKYNITVDHTRPDAVEIYNKLIGLSDIVLMGDVAHYYLNYIEEIASFDPDVRFLCTKVDREEAIQAWVAKASVRRWPARMVADRLTSIVMRTPYYKTQNFWVNHDGSYWKPDPLWNKCFPDYTGDTVEEVVGLFWDEYDKEAHRLSELLPDRLKIFSSQSIESQQGQQEVLEFLAIPKSEHVYI